MIIIIGFLPKWLQRRVIATPTGVIRLMDPKARPHSQAILMAKMGFKSEQWNGLWDVGLSVSMVFIGQGPLVE